MCLDEEAEVHPGWPKAHLHGELQGQPKGGTSDGGLDGGLRRGLNKGLDVAGQGRTCVASHVDTLMQRADTASTSSSTSAPTQPQAIHGRRRRPHGRTVSVTMAKRSLKDQGKRKMEPALLHAWSGEGEVCREQRADPSRSD